uniref:Uncharacterized protein n=1 Tax=Anguilla anguilla TaxID=7936 RepID=A0A0E9WP97_ANGAN
MFMDFLFFFLLWTNFCGSGLSRCALLYFINLSDCWNKTKKKVTILQNECLLCTLLFNLCVFFFVF